MLFPSSWCFFGNLCTVRHRFLRLHPQCQKYYPNRVQRTNNKHKRAYINKIRWNYSLMWESSCTVMLFWVSEKLLSSAHCNCYHVGPSTAWNSISRWLCAESQVCMQCRPSMDWKRNGFQIINFTFFARTSKFPFWLGMYCLTSQLNKKWYCGGIIKSYEVSAM